MGRSALTHNLLVVSDLHIGEDLIEAIVEDRPQDPSDGAAFQRFLAYYREHPSGGLPWRLIIAGDMIDFVRARILDEVAVESDPLLRAGRALDRIVAGETHPFAELARFIAAGNEVVILKGNHDVDLHWSEIRDRLVDHLVKLAPCDPEQVRARLTFSRWFWHEKDLLYVEHGNQYDRFCSFEHVLEPTIGGRADLEDPIAHQTLRAFGKLIFGTVDFQGIEKRRLIEHFRWVGSLGPKLIAKLFWTYVASVKWMWSTRRLLAQTTAEAKQTHVDRVAETAQRFGLREGDLHAIDALRERPAGWHIRYGLRLLFMDHFVAAIFAVCIAAGVWITPFSPGMRFGALACVAVGMLATTRALAVARDVSPVYKLRRVANRIRGLLGVPFLVFGHSHVPEEVALEDAGGKYFNTGRFAGRMTHVCVIGGEPRAELRKWCAASDAPIAFDAATPSSTEETARPSPERSRPQPA